MATRTLRGSRQVAAYAVARGADGVIPDNEIDRLADVLQKVTNTVFGGLSIGGGVSSFKAGNFKGQFVDWTFTAANTSYAIPHQVGAVPVAVFVCVADRACNIFDTNFQAGWGTNYIQLECDTASAKVKLLLLS